MENNYKKIFSVLLILIFTLSNFVFSDSIYFDPEVENEDIQYLDIKLTRPIVDHNQIKLTSEEGFLIFDKDDKINPILEFENEEIKVVLDKTSKLYIAIVDSWGQTLLEMSEGNGFLIKANSSKDSTIKIENERYRGYIKFDIRNKVLIIINHINLEEYLYGVVPAEMSYSFPIEALKAQAIAARTFAVRNLNKHSPQGFNLCDSTDCQVYHGYNKENEITNLAVDETKGLLAYYGGEPINAQYHSSSGGITQNSVDVWGGDLQYLVSVKDDFSLDSPHSKWTLKIELDDLNNKLISNGINIGLLQRVEIIELTDSGSVKTVKFIGTLDEEVVNGAEFRRIIGYTSLKSTNFNITNSNYENIDKDIFVIGKNGKVVSKKTSEIKVLDIRTKKPVSRSSSSRIISNNMGISELLDNRDNGITISNSQITLEGKGNGHGVGMSQYGAKKMAELGYTFEEILKHYYTGIDIL